MKNRLLIYITCNFVFAILLVAMDGCGVSDNDNPGRERFYYNGNSKIILKENSGYIGVSFNTGSDINIINEINKKYGLPEIQDSTEAKANHYIKMDVPKNHKNTQYFTRYGEGDNSNIYGNQPLVRYSMPVYFSENGILTGLTDEFSVSFIPSLIDKGGIDSINNKYRVTIISRYAMGSLVYLLRVSKESPYDALDMANIYYETDLTEFSEPNLIQFIQPH
jgi:hypothetical protein